MRRTFLLLPLAMCAGAVLAVQDCELNGEHVNPANGSTTEGKTGMMRCRDRDSGQVVREEELRAGKFIGLVRYYKDGRLEREFSVNEKHNREGWSREFYPDRRLAREENYRNGAVIGISRAWHPNGALKRIAARGDDGREAAVAEFNDRGQLRELRCADRPLMGKDVDEAALCGHGRRETATQELYSDKGVLRGRVSHLNGQTTLSETLWDNGKPQDQRTISKDAVVERNFSREGVKLHETRWLGIEGGRTKEYEQEFHESGTLVRERRWQAGELAGEKTWFLNGQLKTDYRYARKDGRGVCQATEYHDNGKPMREGLYTVSNGWLDRPLGSQRQFDPEGRLRVEREYDAKGRLSRERELDEKGQVTRDDAVFEDGSRKAFSATAR